MTGPLQLLIDPRPLVTADDPQGRAKSSRLFGGDVSVAVFGTGNIGAALVALLAKTPGIRKLIVVDRGVFEGKNLQSQMITPRDIGRPKALAMAQHLRRVNPSLRVVAIHDAIENIPFGLLRADIWCSCLDSRAARQLLNERAFRLGVPLWIDAGVEPGGMLARVSTFLPAAGEACLECLWDDEDYRVVEQLYACDDAEAATPPTNGLASLGSLAASLQAIACRLALAESAPPVVEQEIVIDAAWLKHFVTPLRRNPQCRFDHLPWRVKPLPRVVRTLADVARLADGCGAARLSVAGRVFAKGFHCSGCGAGHELALIGGRWRPSFVCPRCEHTTVLFGNVLSDNLAVEALAPEVQALPLRSIGVRTGDFLSLRGDLGGRCFEVMGAGRRPAI